MGDMDVHLVMAVVAFAGARTRHQLGLRTRRLKLDYLAQLDASLGKNYRYDYPFELARASARSRMPANFINPSASV